MAEKLCLQWNDFKDNAIDTFGSLREDKDFTDVTLVCEDGMKIDVHKVIIANSSPFFDNVLRQNKHIFLPLSTSSTVEKQMFIRKVWILSLPLLESFSSKD